MKKSTNDQYGDGYLIPPKTKVFYDPNLKKPRNSKITKLLPCGSMLKARKHKDLTTMWTIEIFNDGKVEAEFCISVSADNCNAIHAFLREIVNNTKGVECVDD